MSHRIWTPEEPARRQLAPGVAARIAGGDRLMFSLVTLDPEAQVPAHDHPQEQMGMLLSGAMELVVNGETHFLSPGDLYLVPGGVSHSAKAGPTGATSLDAFSPPREDYR